MFLILFNVVGFYTPPYRDVDYMFIKKFLVSKKKVILFRFNHLNKCIVTKGDRAYAGKSTHI